MKNIFILFLLVLSALPFGCGKTTDTLFLRSLTHKATDYEGRLVHDWMQLGHQMIKENFLQAPQAARTFGYLGLTAWESVCNGLLYGKSMAGQINDYPQATAYDNKLVYDWGVVLCTAMKAVFPELIDNINNVQRSQVNALAARQEDEMVKLGLSEQVRQDSKDLGQRIAQRIVDRIRKDGREVIRSIVLPVIPERDSVHPWYWDQNTLGQIPVEPMWGTIRTFVVDNAQSCEPQPPHPYSTDPHSAFFGEANEIYQVERTTTKRSIAYHWDDESGRTSSHAGHWFSIAQQLLEREQHNLAESAKTYCLLGFALADGYSACWFSKYKYFMLRPVTYIREVLDANWTPLINTPPHPEYTAAAAIAGAASVIILREQFGDTGFVDKTYLGNAIYTQEGSSVILPERIFSSLTEAGEEAILSGMIGGTHFRRACEEGRSAGQCIAQTVMARTEFGI